MRAPTDLTTMIVVAIYACIFAASALILASLERPDPLAANARSARGPLPADGRQTADPRYAIRRAERPAIDSSSAAAPIVAPSVFVR